MKPRPITVTNYIGKRVNPYQMSNVTPMIGMSNFESFHEYEKNNPEYPCPSLANTEPGKTVMAELKWEMRARGSKPWTPFKYKVEYITSDNTYMLHGWIYDCRQIWVPIVEQKEGEGNRELKLENALRKLMSHYIENPDKQGKFWSKSHPSDDLLNEIKELL